MKDDTITELEELLDAAEAMELGNHASPWSTAGGVPTYAPNMPLLVDLLSVPLRAGATTQSGRLAKAFDSWLAFELRRAGFHPDEVWPRAHQPRVTTRDLATVLRSAGDLQACVDEAQQALQVKAEKEFEKAQKTAERKAMAATRSAVPGTLLPPIPDVRLPAAARAVPHKVQAAINALMKTFPTSGNANILGRFYVKQVDVGVSSWERGPDILISGKTMFSSFGKNTKNRYEETLGEATNLRDRHPLAAMGYAFVVSGGIFAEKGAYARLQDLLLRTRRPDGPYDATMLLIVDVNATTGCWDIIDPFTIPEIRNQRPPVQLGASRFFSDLLAASISNTPVGIHQKVRELRNGAAPGGAPDPMADATDVAAGNTEGG